MQKRPNDSNETRFYLEEHDSGLRVTICHIRRDQFKTGAHILPFGESFGLTVLLQLLNPKSTSLPMHCFTAFLTSLISQALLQAGLDKEPSELNGSVFHYEF
jgi:hypothetical protein